MLPTPASGDFQIVKRVDNLELRSGAQVEARGVLVEVASNGQQFSSSRASFVYNAPVAVSSLYPEHGPERGGVQVVVHGSHLGAGSDYKCRFGNTTVLASFDTIGATMHCASAPRSTWT